MITIDTPLHSNLHYTIGSLASVHKTLEREEADEMLRQIQRVTFGFAWLPPVQSTDPTPLATALDAVMAVYNLTAEKPTPPTLFHRVLFFGGAEVALQIEHRDVRLLKALQRELLEHDNAHAWVRSLVL